MTIICWLNKAGTTNLLELLTVRTFKQKKLLTSYEEAEAGRQKLEDGRPKTEDMKTISEYFYRRGR